MPHPEPTGPLMGHEAYRARELLTDRQLQAYRYYRDANTWDWSARRMGTSRTRVIHHVARAQRKLGYDMTVTGKQKAAYKPQKPAGQRIRVEASYEDLLATPQGAETVRILDELLASGVPLDGFADHVPPEAEAYFRNRLAALGAARRGRRRQNDDDWSRAAGEKEGEFAASLEADFGAHPKTGSTMRPEDFREDDGRGYDVI
jgi:DNA-binding CsgD family transcriptional regulator